MNYHGKGNRQSTWLVQQNFYQYPVTGNYYDTIFINGEYTYYSHLDKWNKYGYAIFSRPGKSYNFGSISIITKNDNKFSTGTGKCKFEIFGKNQDNLWISLDTFRVGNNTDGSLDYPDITNIDNNLIRLTRNYENNEFYYFYMIKNIEISGDFNFSDALCDAGHIIEIEWGEYSSGSNTYTFVESLSPIINNIKYVTNSTDLLGNNLNPIIQLKFRRNNTDLKIPQLTTVRYTNSNNIQTDVENINFNNTELNFNVPLLASEPTNLYISYPNMNFNPYDTKWNDYPIIPKKSLQILTIDNNLTYQFPIQTVQGLIFDPILPIGISSTSSQLVVVKMKFNKSIDDEIDINDTTIRKKLNTTSDNYDDWTDVNINITKTTSVYTNDTLAVVFDLVEDIFYKGKFIFKLGGMYYSINEWTLNPDNQIYSYPAVDNSILPYIYINQRNSPYNIYRIPLSLVDGSLTATIDTIIWGTEQVTTFSNDTSSITINDISAPSVSENISLVINIKNTISNAIYTLSYQIPSSKVVNPDTIITNPNISNKLLYYYVSNDTNLSPPVYNNTLNIVHQSFSLYNNVSVFLGSQLLENSLTNSSTIEIKNLNIQNSNELALTVQLSNDQETKSFQIFIDSSKILSDVYYKSQINNPASQTKLLQFSEIYAIFNTLEITNNIFTHFDTISSITILQQNSNIYNFTSTMENNKITLENLKLINELDKNLLITTVLSDSNNLYKNFTFNIGILPSDIEEIIFNPTITNPDINTSNTNYSDTILLYNNNFQNTIYIQETNIFTNTQLSAQITINNEIYTSNVYNNNTIIVGPFTLVNDNPVNLNIIYNSLPYTYTISTDYIKEFQQSSINKKLQTIQSNLPNNNLLLKNYHCEISFIFDSEYQNLFRTTWQDSIYSISVSIDNNTPNLLTLSNLLIKNYDITNRKISIEYSAPQLNNYTFIIYLKTDNGHRFSEQFYFEVVSNKIMVFNNQINSILTTSQLVSPYIFVLNKQTTQKIVLDTYELLLNTPSTDARVDSMSLEINGNTIDLDRVSNNFVIDSSNNTISFNYTITSLSLTKLILKLKNIYTSSNESYTMEKDLNTNIVYQFPVIDTQNGTIKGTVKNPPHDQNDITVGETISLTTTFDKILENELQTNINIYGINNSLVSVDSVERDQYTLKYSFMINHDVDHRGEIQFSLGDINSDIYTWSATDLLTATNDIYTFPSEFQYESNLTSYYNIRRSINVEDINLSPGLSDGPVKYWPSTGAIWNTKENNKGFKFQSAQQHNENSVAPTGWGIGPWGYNGTYIWREINSKTFESLNFYTTGTSSNSSVKFQLWATNKFIFKTHIKSNGNFTMVKRNFMPMDNGNNNGPLIVTRENTSDWTFIGDFEFTVSHNSIGAHSITKNDVLADSSSPNLNQQDRINNMSTDKFGIWMIHRPNSTEYNNNINYSPVISRISINQDAGDESYWNPGDTIDTPISDFISKYRQNTKEISLLYDHLDNGKVLLSEYTNNSLVLTFNSELHSNLFSKQVESLRYKVGDSGTYQVITSDNAFIDISQNKMYISGINVLTTNDNIHISSILKGPDYTSENPVLSNEMVKLIEKDKIQITTIPSLWFWPKNNTSVPNFYGAAGEGSGLYASEFGGWGGNDVLYNQKFKDWILASVDPQTVFLQTWGSPYFKSHDISGWNPPGDFLLPYRNNGASWYDSSFGYFNNEQGHYFMSGNIVYLSRWVHLYWMGARSTTRLFDLNNNSINNFRYGMGFSSSATVTRVYCNKSGITNESILDQYLHDAIFKFTGYNSSSDLFNKNNGTLLLTVTGTSWMNGWTSFTTIGNFSHIDYEKINNSVGYPTNTPPQIPMVIYGQ